MYGTAYKIRSPKMTLSQAYISMDIHDKMSRTKEYSRLNRMHGHIKRSIYFTCLERIEKLNETNTKT